jgi:hypothetical protein
VTRATTWLFAATLCVSAALLFCVQPMVAKLLAPQLGSTPAVWNTCMLFFQTALLAGYAYAHWAARLATRTQIVLHFALLIAAALLPIQLRAQSEPPAESTPVFWLLATLAATVGLPFFIVASTSPLLQRWFSRTAAGDAGDPYFLYSASNVGSLVALLAYPAVIEPALRLREQAGMWSVGFLGLMALTAMCAIAAGRTSRGGPFQLEPRCAHPSPALRSPSPLLGGGERDGVRGAGTRAESSDAPALTPRRRATWVLLAFIPSSLMLGVTTHITTDIASIPLLWVIPLALYLATFVLVFARCEVLPVPLVNKALPYGVMCLVFLLCTEATQPVWMLLALHLATFFAATMVCHARLASDRPPAEQLTEFYLWMSFGGVLGGVFNALLAPVLFNGIVEYPLALALACLVRPKSAVTPRPASGHPLPSSDEGRGKAEECVVPSIVGVSGWSSARLDLPLALACGALAAGLALAASHFDWQPARLRNAFVFGPPAILGLAFMHHPRRFAFAVAGIFIASLLHTGAHGRPLHRERNFFGVTRVTLDASGTFHQVVHGNTVHGRQFIAPERRCEPLAYYHVNGPLGDLFAEVNSRRAARVGVIGLGAGSMASYAQPGQSWTYFEIDPAVIRLARGTNYFTYLAHCARAPVMVVPGDARLQLRRAADAGFDFLVLDAFSSDSIPQHLLTREAFELYIRKLAPGGLLAAHISNRYLNLAPVIANIAGELGLHCRSAEDMLDDAANGKEESHWMLLARREEDLGRLQRSSRFIPLAPEPGRRVWTDDYSNILGVFEWK